MIQGKTACGLQYAVKRSGAAAAYCALSIRCGTRDEQGYSSGIAHFVEHTIFKGTAEKKASTINGYLDRLGGELNAYTTKEEIVLHATVLKEDITRAASLLFEMATCPVFPQQEIDTEKGVVADEINSYKDSPSEDIYDKFEEMLFDGHPLATPILGSIRSVKNIRREELLSFVKDKFTPDRMAFTIVADIEEKKLVKKIERLCEKWFGDSFVPAESRPTAGPGIAPAKKFDRTVNKKNHQANCIIGNLAPSLYEEKERIAAILMCNILGGPANNSILNNELREKNGWVYGVECAYTQYSDTGIVTVSLGCDKENLDKCLRTVHREIEKLQSTLLSAARLKAAKKQILGQIAISSDSGEAQCLSMGKSLLAYGQVFPAEENIRKIEEVTAEDIRNAALRIFNPEQTCRLTYL